MVNNPLTRCHSSLSYSDSPKSTGRLSLRSWNVPCGSPKVRLLCIFNDFINLPDARTGDAIRRLRRFRSPLPNPAAAWLSARARPSRALNGWVRRRLDVKMDATLKGRRQLLTLYREQDGICPICRQEITEITEWHRHHIIRRSNGGKNTAETLVLLHPECHRQAHSLKLEVV